MINADVRRCLDKAEEMRRLAEQAINEESRQAYRRLAENWRFLAENHRHIATLNDIGRADVGTHAGPGGARSAAAQQASTAPSGQHHA